MKTIWIGFDYIFFLPTPQSVYKCVRAVAAYKILTDESVIYMYYKIFIEPF